MTKNNLPTWRIDNFIPFLLIIGSFFVYLVRLSIVETKLDIVIENQKISRVEFIEWKKQYEGRLGSVESDIKVISSKLSISK